MHRVIKFNVSFLILITYANFLNSDLVELFYMVPLNLPLRLSLLIDSISFANQKIANEKLSCNCLLIMVIWRSLEDDPEGT